MKRVLPLCLALATSRLAHAAPAPKVFKASNVQIDPAAIVLFDKAIAAYRRGRGLSLKIESVYHSIGHGQKNIERRHRKGVVTLQWKVPNLLRLEESDGTNKRLAISDGKTLFTTYNKSQHRVSLKEMHPDYLADVVATAGYGLEEILVPLLTGKNPLPEMREAYADFKGKHRAERLPITLFDGIPSEGLRLTTRFPSGGPNLRMEMTQTTAWFDAETHLLRRVQTTDDLGGTHEVSVEKISAINLNPTFAPTTFTSPPGAKAEEAPEKSTAEASE